MMAEREGFELYCQVIVYRLPALLLSRKRMRLLLLHDMPKYLQVINCYSAERPVLFEAKRYFPFPSPLTGSKTPKAISLLR